MRKREKNSEVSEETQEIAARRLGDCLAPIGHKDRGPGYDQAKECQQQAIACEQSELRQRCKQDSGKIRLLFRQSPRPRPILGKSSGKTQARRTSLTGDRLNLGSLIGKGSGKKQAHDEKLLGNHLVKKTTRV